MIVNTVNLSFFAEGTNFQPPKAVKTTLAPLATQEESPQITSNRQMTSNGNALPEKRSSLDLKNNNTATTKDAYSTPTAVVAPTIPTRPMSKVAPIINTTTKRMTTTVENKITKPVTTVL